MFSLSIVNPQRTRACEKKKRFPSRRRRRRRRRRREKKNALVSLSLSLCVCVCVLYLCTTARADRQTETESLRVKFFFEINKKELGKKNQWRLPRRRRRRRRRRRSRGEEALSRGKLPPLLRRRAVVTVRSNTVDVLRTTIEAVVREE